MAISTLPTYTLPASKALSSITTFVNQLRFKDTLYATGMVKNFVDNCTVGKVDSGKGIVFTFKKSLQPVNNLSTTSSVLTITPPATAQEIIEIDNYKVIPLSVSYQLMADAVPNGALVDTFLNYLYSLLEDTYNFHLFDVMVAELLAWTPTQATQTINIDQYDLSGLTGADLQGAVQWNATEIARVVRKTINNLANKSTAYTDVATTLSALDKNALRMVFNDKYYTDFLANSIASLYHSDVVGEFINVPTIDVLNENVFSLQPKTIGFLMDKDKLALATYYKLQMSFTDASTLFTNSFLHFAYGKGIFSNAVGIKFVENTI